MDWEGRIRQACPGSGYQATCTLYVLEDSQVRSLHAIA